MLKSALLALTLVLTPANPDSVTLAADRRVVTFGDTVRLSGVVAPASERVTLVALPYDGGSFPTEAAPDESGRFELDAVPRVTTQYRARAGEIDSAEAPVVTVRPRVHLVVLSARRGLFHARAEAHYSYEGRFAWLQRSTSRGWKRMKRVRLGESSAVRFIAPLPRGVYRVRVTVEPIPGYGRGISRVARIRR
jgi:hypothetical protein